MQGALSCVDMNFSWLHRTEDVAGNGEETTGALGGRQQGREAGCQQAAHTKREASGCGKYRALWVRTIRCCRSILHGRASNIFSRGAQGCCPLGVPDPDMLLLGAS